LAKLPPQGGLTFEELRANYDRAERAFPTPADVGIERVTAPEAPAEWLRPPAAGTAVVLYLHGGGYVIGSPRSHRHLAAAIARAAGARALLLDYRRAPEHPFPAQIEDATAVYRQLLARGFKAQDIVTSGDSAGGNLAISTVLKLRAEGVALPGAVIAFSPWLDMEHVGATLASNDASDALVKKPVLEAMSGMFLGEKGSRTDPLANPLKADFKGFPRLYVTAGSAETLLDNATDLARIAKAAGVDVMLSVVDGMQHVYPFLAGRAPEADDELRRVAKWFKRL
jgi:acetyl esterase/lipase